MGWLTTSKDAPTLTAKAKKAARTKVDETALNVFNGQRCIGCGKVLWNTSARSNVHPRCRHLVRNI